MQGSCLHGDLEKGTFLLIPVGWIIHGTAGLLNFVAAVDELPSGISGQWDAAKSGMHGR